MDNPNIKTSLNTRPPLPSKKLSKKEQMATQVFIHFLEWRKILTTKINNGGALPLSEKHGAAAKSTMQKDLNAINRQVALAIYSDLEYNYRTPKHRLEELTGKSQVYWNFQILGTTAEGGQGKVRTEQVTTDYFIASLLNALKDQGISLDWKRLGFYLEQARWRVIAEPADREKRGQWRDECRERGIEHGINYPAPWHVANWAGEHITAQEAQVFLSYPATMDITLSPGRIRRLDVACFGPDGARVTVTDEVKFQNRPSILKGLGRRDEKRGDEVGAEFEEMLMRTRRKLGMLEAQERERRMAAEQRVKELEAQVIHLDYELAQRDHQEEELKRLSKENKEMKKWGAEMKKRLEQINTLSWLQDVARKLPKD